MKISWTSPEEHRRSEETLTRVRSALLNQRDPRENPGLKAAMDQIRVEGAPEQISDLDTLTGTIESRFPEGGTA